MIFFLLLITNITIIIIVSKINGYKRVYDHLFMARMLFYLLFSAYLFLN